VLGLTLSAWAWHPSGSGMSNAYTQYRHLAIEGAKPSPSPRQISEIESLLGRPLPVSFREFLQVGNGGYVEYVVDVETGEGRTEPISFCSFFSAGGGDIGTLLGETIFARENISLPDGVLPIARDGGGCMLYLDLTDEGRGRVVAFIHGLPAWAGLRTESAFVELASSFDEYVARLRINREVALDHLEHDATEIAHVVATEKWLDIGFPDWRSDGQLCAAVANARTRLHHAS
jgi:SMI1 / KNR4 family (SUKH-1)